MSVYVPSYPFPAIFLKESVSSRFRGSDDCSGRKSVWMTNIAALFFQSIKFSSSTVMVIILLMNPPIDVSVYVIFTAKGSDIARWLVECF